jgi:protein-L-isoaspartate(D-aspartate) O-methyltransferase
LDGGGGGGGRRRHHFPALAHAARDSVTASLHDREPKGVARRSADDEAASQATDRVPEDRTMRAMTEEHFAILRRHMVEVIAIHTDLMSEELGKPELDERVMAAMRRVPRHLFVPPPLVPYAYQDTPLPIGFDKTISQPFIVALMTDLLDPRPAEAVLEVGTGLGYQTAVLAGLAQQVWSVEIVEEFADAAELRLQELGHDNVGIRIGDGSRGWTDHAPFDKILVTAAPERVPAALLDQLKPGGRMVLPLGPPEAQRLTVVDKAAGGQAKQRALIPVRFSQLETAP